MRILPNSSRIDSEADTLGSYMSFPIHEYGFGMSIRLRLRFSSPMAFLIVAGYLPPFPESGSRNDDVLGPGPFGFLQARRKKPWFGHVPPRPSFTLSYQGKGQADHL